MHRNVKKRDLYKSESCPLNGAYLNLSNINPALPFVYLLYVDAIQ